MKKKYIGLFDSTYSLFLFLLIYPEKVEETYFFFLDGIPSEIRKKMKHSYFKSKYTKKKNFFGMFIRYMYRLKVIYISKIINPPKVFGQDHIFGADMLISKYKFFLFEDGYANYIFKNNEIPSSILKNIKEKIFKIKYFKFFGEDENVEKIYLTGLAQIPKTILPKTSIVSIDDLWNKKTIKQKNDILSFYNLNSEFLLELKQKSYLLITQPLSEDNIISEEEKLAIYRKITSDINPLDLVIKVHPREETNYKTMFPDAIILDNPFPSQLLRLMEIYFSKIITLYSTAASDFLNENSELIFYGTSYDKRFVEKHGVIFYNNETNSIELISNS